MSKNFIPVLIFITIYAKSCYTFPYNADNHGSEQLRSDKSNADGKTLISSLYYNTTTRKFYIDLKNQDVAEGRSRNTKNEDDSMNFFDSVLDFFSGIIYGPFSAPADRKPPKRKNTKLTKQPVKVDDYDDPISNFLDGLENMFFAPANKKLIIKTTTASSTSATKAPSSISSSQSTSWFGWYDDYDQSHESSSEEVNHINTEISAINDRMDVDTTTTPEAYSETPTIPTTVKPLKIKSSKFTSNFPTTISYSQFLNERIATMPNQMSNALKQVDDKNGKDCPEKKPVSWMPQFFGTTNNIETTTQAAATTSGAGWFSFLTAGGDEDNDDDAGTTEPSTSWFSSFFSEDTSTKSPVVITSTPLPSTTVAPTSPSWFDAFVNAEEDDQAYSTNKTSSKQKKGRRKNYKGYQLLRLYPNNLWKVNNLRDLQEDTQGSGLMWWSSPALNRSADLLVPPDLLSDVKDHLNSEGMQYDVVIWDLQNAIAYENPKLSKVQRLELETKRGHPLTWRRYHRYADILRYMEFLSLKYSDKVELIPFGRSSEGLPIMGAKISYPTNESDSFAREKKKWKLKSRMKPAIWIDGGVHAREWISPAVVTWILHTLVEGEHGSGAEMDMLKIADWYILPVVNPDGYEYTHTKDRLWRKSRSAHSGSNVYYNSWFPWNWGKTECLGVDLNRNWDYHWGEKGASNDPCNDHYAGPNPFSEPETRSISNFIMDNKDQMKVYLTLHAYSQMWALPSTHSRDPFVDNAELMEMGKLALNALKDVSGTKYEIGSMSELLLPITGASHDWAKGRAAIKYAYAIKMRDSRGPYGFLLPGSQITATAKETWEAIKTVADNL